MTALVLAVPACPQPGVFPGGEASVPGGLEALAAAAHLRGPLGPQDFFRSYCGAIVEQADVFSVEIPQYRENLLMYFSAAADLARLGRARGETSTITIRLAPESERVRAERVLAVLGWTVQRDGPGWSVEPDHEAGASRRGIAGALSIDEMAMRQALQSGSSYTFAIRNQTARLAGSAAWNALLADAAVPGGIAEAFARDLRLARVCFALSSMSPEAAAAVVRGVGLSRLVENHSVPLWHYGQSFAVAGGSVLVPGGPQSEQTWGTLVGKSPRDAPAFFRDLLKKDFGRFMGFYWLLSRATPERARFFTNTASRARRFYHLYCRSDDWRPSAVSSEERVAASFFRTIPLDSSGRPRFPGGRHLWIRPGGEDDDTLLDLRAAGLLSLLSRLEQRRKEPLDELSVKLLLQRNASWRALFPYFESLPELTHHHFQALGAFSDQAGALPPERRSLLLGQWHSLVKLAILGVASGGLTRAGALDVFRRACEIAPEADRSARILEILRQALGDPPDLDEAVAGKWLRLRDSRRAAFDRVREIQHAPPLAGLSAASDAAEVTLALSGILYGAFLDPQTILVSEDKNLLRKHRFAGAQLFPASELIISNRGEGSYFLGGFMDFEEQARRIALGGRIGRTAAFTSLPAAPPLPQAARNVESQPGAVFRASARLVEVYASVTDDKGRYVAGLTAADFTLRDEGQPMRLAAFENRTSALSCALLMDTSGSMSDTLPALQAAALILIDSLRPSDSVAVFGFNNTVSELQPFTGNKHAAARAILRAAPRGGTALYDAMIRVTHSMSGRPGKKAVIIFTDGADNSSMLTDSHAILVAKTHGVPVYTIAQGDAQRHSLTVHELRSLSQATGAISFTIRTPSEIESVFARVIDDLAHGYLLVFQPAPAGDDRAWRRIEVKLTNSKDRLVRAREGYTPD